MQLDSHIHSFLSPDSEMDPANVVRILRSDGLGCCFTDHVDYVTPEEGLDPSANDRPAAAFDFLLSEPEEFPEVFFKYKDDDVFLGLEIGLTAAYYPLNSQTASRDGMDFVVGSVHFVDGLDVTGDFFKQYEGDPYRRFLEYTLEMIEQSGFFDSLGHIDYISRYSPLDEKNVLYAAYRDEYQALFKALAAREKALEINTERFGDARAEANLYQIYKHFRLAGGKYVTIGTDAHSYNELGRFHARALRMARETGLAPVYFKDREMRLCK